MKKRLACFTLCVCMGVSCTVYGAKSDLTKDEIFARVDKGMTMEQVISAIGEPSYPTIDKVVTLNYITSDDVQLIFSFTDGQYREFLKNIMVSDPTGGTQQTDLLYLLDKEDILPASTDKTVQGFGIVGKHCTQHAKRLYIAL